jgi:hypothetical protein
VRARFSAQAHTGPGEMHAVSCTMGTGSFVRVKRPGVGVNHKPPFSAGIRKRVELRVCLYSPSGPLWLVLGRTLPLPTVIFFSYFCQGLACGIVRLESSVKMLYIHLFLF